MVVVVVVEEEEEEEEEVVVVVGEGRNSQNSSITMNHDFMYRK